MVKNSQSSDSSNDLKGEARQIGLLYQRTVFTSPIRLVPRGKKNLYSMFRLIQKLF